MAPNFLGLLVSRPEALAILLGIITTQSTLYIASHQFLVIFRWLPVVQLVVSAIFQTLLAVRHFRSANGSGSQSKQMGSLLGTSPSSWTVVIGLAVVLGVQHTLFIWSFLKLPPACAIAIHALAEPLSNVAAHLIPGPSSVATNRSPRTLGDVGVKTWARIILLLLVIDRVVPMNSSGLIQALASMALNVLSSVILAGIPHGGGGGGASSSPSFITSLLSIIPAWLMTMTLAPTQFGVKSYSFKDYAANRITFFGAFSYALYQWRLQAAPLPSSTTSSLWNSVAVSGALVATAFMTSMKERIAWWDVIHLTAFAYITWLEVGAASAGETSWIDEEADRLVFGAEDFELPGQYPVQSSLAKWSPKCALHSNPELINSPLRALLSLQRVYPL